MRGNLGQDAQGTVESGDDQIAHYFGSTVDRGWWGGDIQPSQASFQDYYAAQTANGAGFFKGTLESAAAKEYAKTFTYNDNFFWANMTKGGKTVFTGAFAHWFVRDEAAAKPSINKW